MKDAIWLNEYFRLALDASPSGQLIVDRKGVIRHINNKISEIFGYSAGELKERSMDMLVPEDFRDAHPAYRENFFNKPLVRAMGSGQVLFGLHKLGGKIPIEIGLNPLSDQEEEYVLASIVDISERVKSERRFQLALEASPSGLILIDHTGNIILVNSKIEEIFGYYRDELMNHSIGMLVPEKYRENHPKHIMHFLEKPKSRAMGIGRELFGLRKNGAEVPIEIGLNPLEIEGHVHVLASVVDITERKSGEEEKQQLNKQVQYAQRMESLGILAGGTAHDFNNILCAISGNAELVTMALPFNSPGRERIVSYIDNIVKSCKRASDLTNQMLAYAGKSDMSVEAVCLNDIINDMLNLLDSTIPKKIKISTTLQSNLPTIQADRSQVQQVILNLVTNASEAIGGHSGEIKVCTGTERISKEQLNKYKYFDYLDEGEYQYLLIEDNGCGMPKEVIESMFDPFFTTKFTGRGLGMASVLGIIRSHYGSICVESRLNAGASIKVIFPENKTSSTDYVINPDGVTTYKSALVIDDEQDITNMFNDLLHMSGFDVTTASNGNSALASLSENESEFDLIVLDMNMPGMSGFELYDSIVDMGCKSKIIIISGYSEEQVSSLLIKDHESGKKLIAKFMHKPFEFKNLRAEIEDLFPRD